MLQRSAQRIEKSLSDEDVALDVGAWGRPFRRADWVLDLMPYESRGLYGHDGHGRERFGPDTWVIHDICDREPWPFEDNQFDFVICSHTLEDIRDPVWVCHELNRVARAGYIEVPSRLEEHVYGFHGPWVGWSHHRWLCETTENAIEFVFKYAMLEQDNCHFPPQFRDLLTPEERVEELWWEGSFDYEERIFMEPPELRAYVQGFVERELERRMPEFSRRNGLRKQLDRAEWHLRRLLRRTP